MTLTELCAACQRAIAWAKANNTTPGLQLVLRRECKGARARLCKVVLRAAV